MSSFAAFPLNKHAQGRVPEKNEHDESAHCAYGDNELRRCPPWRTFQKDDVVRAACDKEEAFISRERQGWPPKAGVEHAHARGRNQAAFRGNGADNSSKDGGLPSIDATANISAFPPDAALTSSKDGIIIWRLVTARLKASGIFSYPDTDTFLPTSG